MKRILILAPLFFPLTVFAQGPLAPPPGAPAPSMSSLGEIATTGNNTASTTTAIKAAVANHTLISTSSGTYTIFESGTYVLTSDRVAPAGNDSIRVQASDVVIDLNGFTISATNSTSGGISGGSSTTGLTVRNGTIRDCDTAISAELAGSSGLTIENVTALDCTGFVFYGNKECVISGCVIRGVAGTTAAINLRENSVVKNTRVTLQAGTGIQGNPGPVSISDCTISGGVSGYGINTGDGCSVSRCTVSGNAGMRVGNAGNIENSMATSCSAGLRVGTDSRIKGCVASANSSSATFVCGVEIGARSSVVNSTASSNTSTNATPSQLTGAGFYLGNDCVIENCNAGGNLGAGIYVGGNNCTIVGNTLTSNGASPGVGAGIFVAATSRNRIEGNHAIGNATGFQLSSSSTKNILIRNTAGGNLTNNWNVPATNFVAPVVAAAAASAFTGNAGGAALGSTDPNANFTLP